MSILVSYLVAPGEVYQRKARDFFDSYVRHPAGMPHDLLIVNRTESPLCLSQHTTAQAQNVRQVQHENTGGWDIDSLLQVVIERSRYDWLLWFGSSCRILADRWLSLFYGTGHSPQVGAVASTGSFETGLSGQSHNPHLRTACLLIAPRVLNSLDFGPVTSRRDCYEFEHGRASLYRRLQDRHLRGVVVGADGNGYDETNWEASLTYRRREQSNLLVADKQTDAYLVAEPPERTALARMAGWQDW